MNASRGDLWAYQSKTTTERTVDPASGKTSVGRASGTAFAANNPADCKRGDCTKPVALVGGVGTGRVQGPQGAGGGVCADMHSRCPPTSPASHSRMPPPPFHPPSPPPRPPRLQVTTRVVPGTASAGPQASASAVAKGGLLSVTSTKTSATDSARRGDTWAVGQAQGSSYSIKAGGEESVSTSAVQVGGGGGVVGRGRRGRAGCLDAGSLGLVDRP